MTDQDFLQSKYLDQLSVLYVEDEDFIRTGLARLLGRRISNLTTASNGQEGLDFYIKNRPDIIITDIRMPIMDGLEMARHIKEINPDAPIIITTAYNDEEYFLKSIDLGIDKYIKKPINKNELLRVLHLTAKTILQQKEIESKDRFIRLILDNSPEFIMICNESGITYLNKSFLGFLGSESLEAFFEKHNSINDFLVSWEDSFYRDMDFCIAINQMHDHPEQEFMVHMIRDGELISDARIYLIHVIQIPDHIEKLITFSDITEIEKEKSLYKELAIKDPLTGIFNRAKFNEMIVLEIQRAVRYSRPIGLIMFDIDHFKNVNDTFGHQVGDAILQEIAHLVHHNLRVTDFFARYGGEEFIIIAPETDLEESLDIAEKLRLIIEGKGFDFIDQITCSFGVTTYKPEESVELFLKRVDEALYRAKNRGRNRVERGL